MVIDQEGIVRFANPAAQSLLGQGTGGLVGLHLGSAAILDPVDVLVISSVTDLHDVELRSRAIPWEGRTAALTQLRDVTALRKTQQALEARNKALHCLSELGRIMGRNDASFEDLLHEVAHILPPACLFAEDAVASIRFHDRTFATGDLATCLSRASTELTVDGVAAGSVDLGYRSEHPPAAGGPFSQDERDLLGRVAQSLGRGLERRLAEEAVGASELRYRRLFEAAKDGILILDADTGAITDVNPFLLNLLRYSREEVVGRRVWELGVLGDIVANKENFQELRREAYIRYADKALQTRDGRRVEVEFVSNAYQVNSKRVIQCNIRDISERMRSESALQASRQLTSAAMSALPARVFWKDRDLVYRGCNEAFARDAGLADPADIVGKTDDQMPWRAQAAFYRADDLEVIASGAPKLLIEEPQTTLEGDTLTLLTSKVPLRDASDEVVGVLGTYMDITPLKRAEASEAQLATAVQHAAEGILITEPDGTILHVNPAFEAMTGYTREEAVGQNPRILNSGRQDTAYYEQMWATLNRGEVWRGRISNKRKDGTLYEVETTISPMYDPAGDIVSFIGVQRDVTEQEQLETQLRRAQRLESIGSLAAGVAHDLNNALAPILMVTEMLRLDFPKSASEDLDVIRAGVKRGADLVKQLLNFARGAEGERLPVRLQPLCKEVKRLILSTFPKNIELRMDCPTDLPQVLGDATQLHQVLLNLCVNARDAMPDGGTITVEAIRRNVSATGEMEILNVRPGPYVAIQVTDTGTGIPREILDRIFDPFFTTKASEKGTGLGLATSLGIVKGHGGFIRAYSVAGQGSTFTVYLPAHHEVADSASPKAMDSAFQGHGETILVVDDEAPIRSILRRVLTKLNFKVLTAAEGTSALREVSEHGPKLAAVITDLHMPELDGLSFVHMLRKQSPETGVILVSGLIEERERKEFTELGVRAMLNKPFTEEDLVTALRTIFVG